MEKIGSSQADQGAPDARLKPYMRRKRDFTRATILDAAESLMTDNENDDFSMRDLAAEAQMAVTTVFAHFGSKAGVFRGLIDRLLDKIERNFDRRAINADRTVARVFAMAEAGLDVIIEAPGFNQRILGSLLMVGEDRVYVELQHQTNYLWIKAIGNGGELAADTREVAVLRLPEQMTVSFRGALALWIAEGLTEAEFRSLLLRSVTLNLLGFVSAQERDRLISALL